MIRTSERMRGALQALLCPLLTVAAVWLCAAPAAAQLLAGAARVEITPNVKASPVPLGGYFARRAAPSTGIHDPVYARAIVFQSGTVRMAVVSVDLCFLPANLRTDVAARLAGIMTEAPDRDHLFLAATHTHTAPDPLAMHAGNTFTNLTGWTLYDPALRAFTADRIATAIKEAAGRLTPACLGCSAIETKDLNRNRRGDKLVDPALTVLKVSALTGKPIAAIVNFAAHPTLYDEKMMEVSADWPGIMTADVEKELGAEGVCLFLNGAEGDASPNGVDQEKGDAKVAAYGHAVSSVALQALKAVMVRPDAHCDMWSSPVALPPRKASVMFIIAAGQAGAKQDQARALVDHLMPAESQVTFARLGDLLLLGFPCEPSAEIGLAAKEAARKAGYTTSAVVALTNDWLAYCLMPQQYRAGKYEAMMSFYGDQFGPAMLAALDTALASRRQPATK